MGPAATEGRGGMALPRRPLRPVLPGGNRGARPARPPGASRPAVALRDRHLRLVDLALLLPYETDDDPVGVAGFPFGSRSANPRHVKKRFLGYLRSVIDYYPEIRLESTSSGLLLKPSPTHVEPQVSRRPRAHAAGTGIGLRDRESI